VLMNPDRGEFFPGESIRDVIVPNLGDNAGTAYGVGLPGSCASEDRAEFASEARLELRILIVLLPGRLD